MPTNVTQKDETLKAIIDICLAEQEGAKNHEIPPCQDLATAKAWIDGYTAALNMVMISCRRMFGYSGSMPLEVENQSEDAQ